MRKLLLCLVTTGLCAVSMLTPSAAAGAEAAVDSTGQPGSSRVILPVLAYSPDTALMFGGTVLNFFYLEDDAPGVRPSLLVPVLIHTTKSQTMAVLSTDLNWGRGRNHLQISGSYQRFPDTFYGIGRTSRADDEEDFTPESGVVSARYDRRVVSDLRLGLGWQWNYHFVREYEADGLLDSGTYPGLERMVLPKPQIFVGWDSRDNTWSPRRGLLLQANLQISRRSLGSDAHFTSGDVDLRGYHALGDRAVLAAQLRTIWVTGSPPFFVLPRLGGQDGLRGYLGGRYLDAARVIGRVEWRSGPLWRRIGCAVFAGLGDVAPRFGDLTTHGGLWTAGGGLRVMLNEQEQVNIRIDMALGRDSSGFFLSLGEAF